MFNKAILMGRICNNLELKTIPNGTNYVSFRLAVDRSYQVKGEEKRQIFLTLLLGEAMRNLYVDIFQRAE